MLDNEKEASLDKGHRFAATLNAAVIYVVYLMGLGAGVLLHFNPPLSQSWIYGVLLFGGLVITLLVQMKFARRIWARGRQDRYLSRAAIILTVLFVVYIILRNVFVMDYNNREVVVGWSLTEEWRNNCDQARLGEVSECIKAFGDRLHSGQRADAFFGRLQISTVLTGLHLVYCFMAFALIFAITGLLEMLRPTPTSGP